MVVMTDIEINYKGLCEKLLHFLGLVSHTVDKILSTACTYVLYLIFRHCI